MHCVVIAVILTQWRFLEFVVCSFGFADDKRCLKIAQNLSRNGSYQQIFSGRLQLRGISRCCLFQLRSEVVQASKVDGGDVETGGGNHQNW